MEGEIRRLNIPAERRTEVFRLIDRRDKMSAGEWQAYAKETGLSDEQFEGLKAVLADEDLWQKSEEMQRFFSAVNALGVGDYVRYAPHIIRGLEYYTGTVFECWDVDGEFRAILGGGRYDNLVGDVGGQPLPGVGFAMGDLVVSLVLQKFNCLPQALGASPAEVLVTVFDEKSMANSLRLAAELRQAGLKTAVYPEPTKLGKQFKYADRMGVRVAAILGPDELATGQVAIKDLKLGAQQSVARQAATGLIRQLLDSHLPS